ncbi:MAG: hypothetical protein AAGK37_19205 [Pseudomonadota bacterium]
MTAPPGTLRTLDNAVITAGGEIEKRQAFGFFANVPSETKGLAFLNNNLVVFGLSAPAPALPAHVTYHQLVTTTPGTLDRILDVQVFQKQLYVVARLSGGEIIHFYNGTEILVPTGTAVHPFGAKMYSLEGADLRFSAVNDATDWDTAAGYGLLDVTAEDAEATELVGLAEYYGQLALFGRKTIQIWAMDPDPLQNARAQTIGNVGLVAPHGAARYGSGDVLFLADTGIRSLRARNSSNAASVNDIGSPVDELIQARRAVLTPTLAEKIDALVDPLTGRFWMIFGDTIYVLSAFPNTQVSAWSTFMLPGEADYVTLANSRVAVRIGDEIRVYGPLPTNGDNPFDPNTPLGTTAAYDEAQVTIETPFLDIGMPATTKVWEQLDVSAEGSFTVQVNPDYGSAAAAWVTIAQIDAPTWRLEQIPIEMSSTHIAVRLVSNGSTVHRVASMALHYQEGDT